MLEFETVHQGFLLLLNWQIPIAILGGMLLGLVIGAIPGMTAALGLAALLPLTFKLEPLTALILMTSVYTGSLTGGGFLAVLINTPGTPGAAATTFDGYAMTQSGRQNEALGLQIAASVIGGTVSYLVLLIFIQSMAEFALLFGSAEMLFLTIFVMLLVATLQRKSFARSIFAGLLGLLLSTIGTSVTTGVARGTMGVEALEDGLPIILCVIGMFAIPELISIVAREAISTGGRAATNFKALLGGAAVAIREVKTWMRGAAIGTFVGVLPAAGATIASLLAYGEAARRAKPGEVFGQGEPKGIIAAESANNASEGGAMAILMSLGIPGSASTAVILGAFMIHGLVPGPRLFVDNGALVYGLILGNLAQMLFLGFFAILVASQVAKIASVPSRVLAPTLAIILSLGAFSFRGLWEDIVITFIFGVIGYWFRRHHFTLIALMIGLFLGRQIDEDFVRFIILYADDPLLLTGKPIAMGFFILSIGLIGWQTKAVIKEFRGD